MCSQLITGNYFNGGNWFNAQPGASLPALASARPAACSALPLAAALPLARRRCLATPLPLLPWLAALLAITLLLPAILLIFLQIPFPWKASICISCILVSLLIFIPFLRPSLPLPPPLGSMHPIAAATTAATGLSVRILQRLLQLRSAAGLGGRLLLLLLWLLLLGLLLLLLLLLQLCRPGGLCFEGVELGC